MTSNDTHQSSLSIGSQQRYAIVVKTSDMFGAETETNVYIRIKGEHRWCDAPIALDTSLVNKKKFRRNQVGDQLAYTDCFEYINGNIDNFSKALIFR